MTKSENMNIKDHPDFKVTETVEVCPNCDEPTVFETGSVNGSTVFHECQSCGFDEVTGEVSND